MTSPLGASAFASLGAVPQSSLGASAFSSLGAVPKTPAPQQPSTLSNVVNSPGVQGVLGAGDAVRNTVASGLNMLPGVNISPAKSGSGTAYTVGNIAGNIGAFMGGGEALDTARAASESAPVIGQLATALGGNGASGIARRALGSAAYGAAATNQNRTQNAGTGAGLSLVSEAIPGVAGKIAQGAQYFMPQRYAQNIIQTLGGGQNLEDATKSVLSSVRNAYQAQKANASDLYNPVFNSVPSGSIYANVGHAAPESTSPFNINTNTSAANEALVPGRSAQMAYPANADPVSGGQTTSQQSFSNLNGEYPNLPSTITDDYTKTLQKMHNTFINDPTFENAHALQSELGVQQRYLTDGNTAPSIATSNSVTSLGNARNALKSDMMSFLNRQGPALNPDAAPGVANTELAQQYTNASNNYQQNVVPYLANPKIASIALGEKTNAVPSTLSTIFAAPNESMSKVINDLPDDAMNKVLYTKLGQTVPNKSAQGLLNSYQNLQQQGLGAHVSPELASQIGELENRIKARNGLQMATAGLSAAALGGAHGSATAGAMMGLGAGAVASPFMNYIGRRLPIDDVSQGISNVLRGSYPAGRSAVLANYLNNSGVKNGS